MLRQQALLFTRLTVILDLFTVIVAYILAYWVRNHLSANLQPPLEYFWIFILVAPVWYYLLSRHGFYRSIRRLTLFDVLSRMISVHLAGGVFVAAVIYFLDRDQYSRGLFLIFLIFSFLLLSFQKVIVKTFLGFLRKRRFNTRNILIVGTHKKAKRFCQLIEAHKDWGLEIIGIIKVAPGPIQGDMEGHRVLGDISSLTAVCKEVQVDEVVFCIPNNYVVDIEPYLHELEELGITVRMVVDFFEATFYRKELSFFHNELPILTYHPKAFESQQLFLKRLLDICGAIWGLVVTVLLFPLIYLAIRVEDPGPIFFSQDRVGENGRIFRIWKFRSMYQDAESEKNALLSQNEMTGAIFKMKEDPRITRLGRFLRRTSLDELPQFWNVLKGEMSLVGTRPPTPDEVAKYENWQRRRISIKPGITGMWQVNGRNIVNDFDEIVRLDLYYIDHWSLWLDIRILLKTIKVVFAREGSF